MWWLRDKKMQLLILNVTFALPNATYRQCCQARFGLPGFTRLPWKAQFLKSLPSCPTKVAVFQFGKNLQKILFVRGTFASSSGLHKRTQQEK